MVTLGARVLEEWDDFDLSSLIDRCQVSGVEGSVKNVIFVSLHKPDVVLTDALSNEIGLLNSDACLFYDKPVSDHGLTWRQLVHYLPPQDAAHDELEAGRKLHRRPRLSLGSDAERVLFLAYGRRYANNFDQPALLPQVWLRYDPRSSYERAGHPAITRQRMDFLLLLSGRRRVVIEVDGVQHYSENGRPSPKAYAAMVKADRDLRLYGYEVYRFGGAELPNPARALALLDTFFDQLLGKTRS